MNYLLLSPKANSLLTNISLKKLSSLTWLLYVYIKEKTTRIKSNDFYRRLKTLSSVIMCLYCLKNQISWKAHQVFIMYKMSE